MLHCASAPRPTILRDNPMADSTYLRRNSRRQFLKASVAASTLFAIPTIVPSRALGRDGFVAPSERIILGGIGIRRRGTLVLEKCSIIRTCSLSPSRTFAPTSGKRSKKSRTRKSATATVPRTATGAQTQAQACGGGSDLDRPGWFARAAARHSTRSANAGRQAQRKFAEIYKVRFRMPSA
jgi:hypothetical protein